MSWFSEAVNHDVLAIVGSLDLEANVAIRQGEEGVVTATADVGAIAKLGAALPDDDAAGVDTLAAVNLDAKPFRFRIAAVTRTAACLFMFDAVALLSPL